MYLSIAYLTTLKANLRNPFKLTPSARTILFSKPHDVTNISTYGDGFNFLISPNISKCIRNYNDIDLIFQVRPVSVPNDLAKGRGGLLPRPS